MRTKGVVGLSNMLEDACTDRSAVVRHHRRAVGNDPMIRGRRDNPGVAPFPIVPPCSASRPLRLTLSTRFRPDIRKIRFDMGSIFDWQRPTHPKPGPKFGHCRPIGLSDKLVPSKISTPSTVSSVFTADLHTQPCPLPLGLYIHPSSLGCSPVHSSRHTPSPNFTAVNERQKVPCQILARPRLE